MSHRLLPLGLLLVLCSCAGTSVVLAPGQNPVVSEYLTERWLPVAQRAQDNYQKLMHERAGMSSVRTVPVVLAATKAEADKVRAARPKVHVSVLSSSFPDVLIVRTLLDPVRESARLLFPNPESGSGRQTPAWLERGISTQIALDTLREERGDGTLTERIFRSDLEVELRTAEKRLNVSDVLRPDAESGTSAFQAIADFMGETLKLRLADGFYRALPKYLRALESGSSPEQSFQSAFGFSLQSFVAGAETRLASLRAQTRQHLGANDEFVEVSEDVGNAALTTKSMRDSFARYRKQASPKAFVRARTGYVVYFDDRPEALPLALEQCRTVDPLGCRVVSIDDHFVTSRTPRAADIEVRLASTGMDAWTAEVRSKWVPVLRNTVDHFNQVVEKKLGHSLKQPIRIHVVSNREDYARVLRNEMDNTSSNAERSAALSGGVANQKGQMLVSMYSRTPPEFLWETAVTITLHELTHELQGQLRGDGAGFRPARWLDEASADHLAWLTGKELALDPSAKFVLQDWRESVIEWYRLKGKLLTKPENVFNADGAQWMKQMAEARNPYQMAGIMSVHLADRLGDNYFPALLQYWTLSGREGEKEELAFEKCFGMNKAEYLRSLNKWLATL